MKLVRPERESDALRAWIGEPEVQALVSSAICEIEVARAVLRGAPEIAAAVPALLSRVTRMELSGAVRAAAAQLPPTLRSLDAIHLATALDLGSDLEAIVTYDSRLAGAAREHGLRVAQPGV